jgi:hypothetical protein
LDSRFRKAKTIEEKIGYHPGDPEREMEELRKKDGIPINPKVVEDLKELATTFSFEILESICFPILDSSPIIDGLLYGNIFAGQDPYMRSYTSP